jgi:hypothetical protein
MLIEDLERNSSRLEILLEEFGQLTVRNRIQAGMEIRCFFEAQPTQLLNSLNRNFPIKPPEELVSLIARYEYDYH